MKTQQECIDNIKAFAAEHGIVADTGVFCDEVCLVTSNNNLVSWNLYKSDTDTNISLNSDGVEVNFEETDITLNPGGWKEVRLKAPSEHYQKLRNAIPESELIKHPCAIVVQGRTEASIRLLSDWVDNLRALGAKAATYEYDHWGTRNIRCYFYIPNPIEA